MSSTLAIEGTLHQPLAIVQTDATSATTISAVVTDAKGLTSTKGKVYFKLWHPMSGVAATVSAGGGTVAAKPAGSGYMAGAVKIDGIINGSNVVTKVSALE